MKKKSIFGGVLLIIAIIVVAGLKTYNRYQKKEMAKEVIEVDPELLDYHEEKSRQEEQVEEKRKRDSVYTFQQNELKEKQRKLQETLQKIEDSQ